MHLRTMGLVISHKNGEKRRAILPCDVKKLRHPGQLYFETGYGSSIGVADSEYLEAGAHIVTREEALCCDIVTDVKLDSADYLDQLADETILLGWSHVTQSIGFTDKCLEKNMTVIAWEEMFENGRYIFYRNREVAGEAGIMQALLYCGRMPYDAKVAIIGNGQTAKGVMRVLHGLGANIDVFARKHEAMFRRMMYDYDIIVNCVMWDVLRTDRLIYREDLARMKPGTMIVDISCDPYLEIETSHPTTIENPVYTVDGVIHYAVDNTPAMFPITVTKVLSEGCARMFDAIIEDNLPEYIREAVVIEKGHILNESTRSFRLQRGLAVK